MVEKWPINFLFIIYPFRAYLAAVMTGLSDHSPSLKKFKLLLSYNLNDGANGKWVTESSYGNVDDAKCFRK